MSGKPTVVLDARSMARTLRRMADEVVELFSGTDDLILVGIQRRGVQLADRIANFIDEREGVRVARGALDITLYRDDLQTVGPRPVVGPTNLPWAIDGKAVVIVTTSCTPVERSAPRWMNSRTSAGRHGSRWRCWWTGVGGSCRFTPIS